jgi:hypothetical protein
LRLLSDQPNETKQASEVIADRVIRLQADPLLEFEVRAFRDAHFVLPNFSATKRSTKSIKISRMVRPSSAAAALNRRQSSGSTLRRMKSATLPTRRVGPRHGGQDEQRVDNERNFHIS